MGDVQGVVLLHCRQSAWCNRLEQALLQVQLPFELYRIDMGHAEARKRVFEQIQLDSVPALLVVYSNGEGELYKGLAKSIAWLKEASKAQNTNVQSTTVYTQSEEEPQEPEGFLMPVKVSPVLSGADNPEWEPVQPLERVEEERPRATPAGSRNQTRALAEARAKQVNTDLLETARRLKEEAERDRGWAFEQ